MEIELNRFTELLEAETRLGILRRLINDEDAKEGNYRSIETALLRQILGMANHG